MWLAHCIVHQHMKMKGALLMLRNIPDKRTWKLQMVQKSEIYLQE